MIHDIDYYRNLIEEAIRSYRLPDSPAGLYAPIRYAMDCGGKRIRPILCMAMCEALGGSAADVVNQALAIEMFHNFTLLHDDVMDHADMRRGRPTVHVRWDERTAILSGDAMLSIASELVNEGVDATTAVECRRLLHRTAMEVYEGQQYDMDFEDRTDVTVCDYLNMIRLKTSVLLGCACRMGAIVAGVDDECQKYAYRFGELLGLAFQLRDDYLDTYGDPIMFGKEIGGDIVNDKKTWLLITAQAEDTTGVVAQELAMPSEQYHKIERIKRVYDDLGLPERCRELIERYIADANQCVARLGLKPVDANFFTELASKSSTRSH